MHPQSRSFVSYSANPVHHAKNVDTCIMRFTDMLMLQTSVRSVSLFYAIMLEISCFFVEFTNIYQKIVWTTKAILPICFSCDKALF